MCVCSRVAQTDRRLDLWLLTPELIPARRQDSGLGLGTRVNGGNIHSSVEKREEKLRANATTSIKMMRLPNTEGR